MKKELKELEEDFYLRFEEEEDEIEEEEDRVPPTQPPRK